jgi:hypothetical protein
MDFAICLDQFSTNFNVSSLSPNGFNIYTDLDYNNPIASGIPYQDLFAPPIGNCPLVVNVPQGATQILVIDACTTLPTNVAPIFNAGSSANSLVTQCCYAIIPVPVEPISWCDTSGLEFDVFSASFVGQIIAGNLISTLGTVTDYTIGWYKDGNYSSPEFISGYGNAFVPYQLTHPLAGNTSPYVAAGDWEGIIHDIAINGVTYSSVSGSAGGTPIPFISCFGTVVVAPLECGNGTFSLPYTHQKSFTAAGNGATPPVIAATYELDSSTNYFAYYFAGYNVWDELEIKFISGDPNNTGDPSLYSQPIYLEKAQIGQNVNGPNINTKPGIKDNIYPKKIKNTKYKRVLALTNISRSANPSLPDRLDIKITPNPTNNQTSWDLKMQCLDTFDCSDCLDPFPAVKISNINIIDQCCGYIIPQLFLTGSCGASTDLWDNKMISPFPNYVVSQSYVEASSYIASNFPIPPLSLDYNQQLSSFAATYPTTCFVNSINSSILTCAPSTPNSTIGYHKSVTTVNGQPQGIISMSFNNQTDYLYYKNGIISLENQFVSAYGPIVYDPTDIKYYSYYILALPKTNIPCGDGIPYNLYNISRTTYPNITYVEDPINNYWSITIPMPTLLNGMPQTSCGNCYWGANPPVIAINDSSTLIGDLDIINTHGSKFNSFIQGMNYFSTPGGTSAVGFVDLSPIRQVSIYSFETLPFVSSSNGWVNLPSLETILCPSITSSIPQTISIGSSNQLSLGAFYSGYELAFSLYFPDLAADPHWFQIFTTVTSSYSTTLNPQVGLYSPPEGYKIYEYSASIETVYTSSYFWNGSPTLTLTPPPAGC